MGSDPLCPPGISWKACSPLLEHPVDFDRLYGPARPITTCAEARQALIAAQTKCLERLADTSEERSLRHAIIWLEQSADSPVKGRRELFELKTAVSNYTSVQHQKWLVEDTPRLLHHLDKLINLLP